MVASPVGAGALGFGLQLAATRRCRKVSQGSLGRHSTAPISLSHTTPRQPYRHRPAAPHTRQMRQTPTNRKFLKSNSV